MAEPRMITIAELQKKFSTDPPPSERWIRDQAKLHKLGARYGREWLVRESLLDICLSQTAITAGNIRRLCEEDDPHTTVGQIYFIRCCEFIKVGFATNVARRLRDLAASSPFEYELLGSIKGSISAERAIHQLIRTHHHRFEWFHVAPELMAAIEELLNDVGHA